MFSSYCITNFIQTPAGHSTIRVMQFKIKHLQLRPSVHVSGWNVVIEEEECDCKF